VPAISWRGPVKERRSANGNLLTCLSRREPTHTRHSSCWGRLMSITKRVWRSTSGEKGFLPTRSTPNTQGQIAFPVAGTGAVLRRTVATRIETNPRLSRAGRSAPKPPLGSQPPKTRKSLYQLPLRAPRPAQPVRYMVSCDTRMPRRWECLLQPAGSARATSPRALAGHSIVNRAGRQADTLAPPRYPT